MGTLVVPGLDAKPWPTLGPQVCDFLEERCVHGPGDLRGRPYRLDDDKRALVYRAYEVHPRGHPRAGRRRFKRVALSLRKGVAKTELLGALAYAELHPEGPVRCDGFRHRGSAWVPVGRPVLDPYIPLVAYTEEQSDELAYASLLTMVTEGPDVDLFDVGLERIIRLDARGRAAGKAASLATAPDARDGARTTFQGFDETHRLVLPRQVEAHEVMLQNIPKRMAADAWSAEVTTTYTPGEGSVAQATHEDAEQVAKGKVADPTFFFFHREASPRPGEDLDDPAQLAAAIREASGPAVMGWDDSAGQVEAIASLYQQAKRRGGVAYFERVWLNRRTQAARQAFDAALWAGLARERPRMDRRSPVVLGFDGSRWRDVTSLVLTHVPTGWQQVLGAWQRGGADPEDWEVPRDEVEALVDDVFATRVVLRLYGDPAEGWADMLAALASRHGPKRVFEFYTDSRNLRKTAYAVRKFYEAIRAGEVGHDGDAEYAAHIGHARRRDTHMRDDDGHPLWVLEKERHDSPFKIDHAMAGVLSWQARLDVITAGQDRGPERAYAYSA